MLSGGCIFIEHATGYVIIKHQVSINANKTFKAKLNFGREAQIQGVVIKGYHTDNGICNASEFMEELLNKQQKIIFIRAGASHQNGAVDFSIKTVVTMKRTMLIHAVLRYPEDTFSTDIFPMEIYYALWFYNWISNMQTRLSAI